MKKKPLKLSLKKHVISNLKKESIAGGNSDDTSAHGCTGNTYATLTCPLYGCPFG